MLRALARRLLSIPDIPFAARAAPVGAPALINAAAAALIDLRTPSIASEVK
jgi:hypothetical protein